MKIYHIATETFYEIDPKRSSGEEAFQCPMCSPERKKSKDKCMGWNHDKVVGHCSHCNASFVVKREYEHQTRQYARPVFNNRTDVSKKTVDFFLSRGISQDTVNHFKITESEEFMPQLNNTFLTMNFNYFRNEDLINTKFRGPKKSYKMVKDAELIMFNLNAIANNDECIITEGEIDAMSWHEVGITNVVSVPNGASKGGKLDYLDNCFEYFESKKKIYLSTDNDEVGIALQEELARRLGYDKCYKLDFGEHKDANDFLRFSDGSLVDVLKNAREYPIEGVFNIDDNWSEIENIYNHGLPSGDKTGDEELDNHIGFMKGELTMVTGIPGHGKSIFLDQVSLGLCLNSGWSFALCSPESYPMSLYFTRLMKRLVGKPFGHRSMALEEVAEAKAWLSSRYHLIMPKNGFMLDEVLDRARQLVLRKGIKGLIIDPWNRIENNMPSGYNEGKWIIECLIKIINFAQTSGVHVFLVAHPTKMMKERDGKNFIIPNLYSISGSAHFFNLTHNGFTVYRNYKSGLNEVHIQKIKWEHLGKIGKIEYRYAPESARFYPEFGLSDQNWLIGGNRSLIADPEFKDERKEYEETHGVQSEIFSAEQTEQEAPF